MAQNQGETSEKNRVVGYVRVSTDDQARGTSPDAQKQVISDCCKAHSWNLVRIYEDPGVTGVDSVKRRKGLLDLLDEAANETFDWVLVVDVDRLARDLADYKQMEKMLRGLGIGIVETSSPGISTLTKDGRLHVGMKSVMAEYEIDEMKDRQRRVLDFMKQEGKHLGRIPRGFILKDGFLVPDEFGSKTIKILLDNPKIRTKQLMTQLEMMDYWQTRLSMISSPLLMCQGISPK